jgi:hypothetical protein
MPMVATILDDPNIWICDTAATTDATPHDMGMVNKKKATHDDCVTMGNGATEEASMIGDIPGIWCNQNGDILFHTKLTGVTYVPNSAFNLFSATKRLQCGWSMTGDGGGIKFSKGKDTVLLDLQIETKKGAVYCADIQRSAIELGAVATNGMNKMTAQQAHSKLGHLGGLLTSQVAKDLGWVLTRTIEPCKACAIGKARQKNIPKNLNESKENNDPKGKDPCKWYLDIASVKQRDEVKPKAPYPHWRILVDDHTGMKVSHFFATENGMITPTCKLFNRWKQNNVEVNVLRMDNAGENKALARACGSHKWKLNI